MSTKRINPLDNLKPINARVAVPMQKDIAMAAIATQFIGVSSAPPSTPSSTRNYQLAWNKLGLANTGSYTANDIVMISGSGSWRGVSEERIEAVFRKHYVPLLEKVAAAKAKIVVGAAPGTDQLVCQWFKARSYKFVSHPAGYLEGYQLHQTSETKLNRGKQANHKQKSSNQELD